MKLGKSLSTAIISSIPTAAFIETGIKFSRTEKEIGKAAGGWKGIEDGVWGNTSMMMSTFKYATQLWTLSRPEVTMRMVFVSCVGTIMVKKH